MIKQIKIKLVFFELIALIFLVNGLQRLYLGSQGSKLDALVNENWEKFGSLSSITIGQFLANRAYWTFGFLLLALITVGIINWKKNVGIINSIILLIITFGIIISGFFLEGLINRYLNYFCGLFAESYSISFLIGGTILTLIGFSILWKTIYWKKLKT